MKKVNLKIYFETPEHFELRRVSDHQDIPRSLVTKTTKWVGFDLKEDSYAKFSKTLFTKLIADKKAANKPATEKVVKKTTAKTAKKRYCKESRN